MAARNIVFLECLCWCRSFLDGEALVPEDSKDHKAVYLVTLPHPQVSVTEDGHILRAPGDHTRSQILTIMHNVFSKPLCVDAAAGNRTANSIDILSCVIFQERHCESEDGQRHIHYHVALKASKSFRFAAYKRALKVTYGLASHWSTSHTGYWSTVRYGCMPTLKKQASELDAEPLAWARGGPHPALFDSAQEPITATALRRRRQIKVQTASEKGKAEPKATEMDLYAIIVQQDIRNTADDPWADKKLIEHIRKCGGAALFELAWRTQGFQL